MAWKIPASALLILLLGAGARGQTKLFQFDGSGTDSYGRSVAVVGDVDLDGHADVIVGATQGDASTGFGKGFAQVRSGKDGSILYTFTGTIKGDNFGWSVSGAGDVNQDGHPDLIVGAPIVMNGHRKGYAKVFSGKDGALLDTFQDTLTDTQFGLAVGAAGDVDSDGFADVIVGAPFDNPSGADSGSAWVFSGKTGAALHHFTGDSALDYFAWSTAGAGDLNQDGFTDLVVGADWDDKPASKSGSVTVYSGKDGGVLYAFAGDSADDTLGHSVAAAGDVDHDGFADVIAGAPQGDPVAGGGPGYGRLFSGKDGSVLATLSGNGNSVDFGVAVAGAGDVDADGFDDVILGDWFDTTNGVEAGAAWVVSGKDGSVLYHPLGPGSVVNFGVAVGGGFDLNQDGQSDFIVGGYSGNTAVAYSGKPCPASSSSYGTGYPGTNGVPGLTSDDPVLCTTIALQLGNSRGATTAGVLLLGFSDAQILTGDGGTLLVLPSFVVPIVVPAGGLVAHVGVPCDSAFCGLAMFLQAMEADPGAGHGVSFTAGLKMVLGGE